MPERFPQLVALAAIVFSAVYFASDLIEVAQGDFSTGRLSLTYVGEAAIPLFVIGLYAVQRPRIGWLGLFGATAYAYAYVFFTGTVLYALIDRTQSYAALTHVFRAWMTVHGGIMLVGGLAFGLATVKAGALPRWTGVCLMVGVVLVASASGLPNLERTIAAAFPATAFAGMGIALLHRGRPQPWPSGDKTEVRREQHPATAERNPLGGLGSDSATVPSGIRRVIRWPRFSPRGNYSFRR